MLQIVQDIRRGGTRVCNVPAPLCAPNHLLIANRASVISAGTERMVIEIARKSLIGKARERPDQVKRVLQKVRTEGLMNTIKAVQAKLDEPVKMGYASAGTVIAVGSGIQQYKVGDRVASNGPHAGIVCVPKNLCARVPDGVSDENASFAVLGSIALQGVRLTNTTLGETVFVIGLGLVGQLAVAIARASGCRVIGTDPDPAKCELAIQMGADIAKPSFSGSQIEDLTGGLGADAVVICASTSSNGPIDLAAAAVRPKGRVVLTGVVGLTLDRRPFYFKEAEFVVSCSYGPGRYDPSYEDLGRDYPAAHVRWTQGRNIQSVLDLMGSGRLDVQPLISHRFDIDKAEAAYDMIDKGSEPYLGIVLAYPELSETPERQISIARDGNPPPAKSKLGLGFLGAGNFARGALLPAALEAPDTRAVSIASAGGMTAADVATKMGFAQAASDDSEVIGNPDVNALFIVTRHNQHADQVCQALQAGKDAWVEKPLCLTVEELEQIETARANAGDAPPRIMLGFNRRFAPATELVKKHFATVTAPLTVSFRFNAGEIPHDHWTQDDEVGGGRIIGEACHAIDLVTYLTGGKPVRVFAESIGGARAPNLSDDQCFITLRHENGSISNVGYLAGGDKSFPKERIEVIGGGRIAVIDDWTKVTLVSGGKQEVQKLRMDKGHKSAVSQFLGSIREGKPCPIAWSDTFSVSLASIMAVQSLRDGTPIELPV